jgi:hypothetical protein
MFEERLLRRICGPEVDDETGKKSVPVPIDYHTIKV